MRILQINTVDSPGGAAKIATTLHGHFLEKGYESRMLVGRLRTELAEVGEIKQSRENTVTAWMANYLGVNEFVLYGGKEVVKSRVFQEADVVHLHNLHGKYFNLGELVEMCKRKPVVWTFHDMWPFTGHCAHSFDCTGYQSGCLKCPYLSTYPRLRFDITRHLYNKKRSWYSECRFHIVTPSSWLLNKVEKSMLADRQKTVIANFTDTSVFRANRSKTRLRKKLGLPQDKVVVMFAAAKGLGNVWKGGKTVLKVSRALMRDKKVMFLVTGSENKPEGTGKNVLCLPYVDSQEELAEYYGASDMFLLTSEAENCPLAIIEALSSGLPVIGTRVGGMVEMLEHKKYGYLVEKGRVDEVIEGIRFFEDKTIAQKAKNLARKKALKDYSVQNQAIKYLRLYKRVIKEW